MQPLTPTSQAATWPPAGQAHDPPLAAVRPESGFAGRPWWAWGALALITAAAAVLRLIQLGQVPPDPFYDAAVRSMGLSWHNFFFGAFEPSGSVSIDKPPVDLWLQVASTKLVGFSETALKLPEALAGIASVPLLFAAVRRMWNVPAGLVAALALAVLPIEVITSRSDTMDGVMMLLIVLTLLLVVHACRTGRERWLFAGAAALGVAFDVKLLESLVALPGLAVFAYLGLPWGRSRRLLTLGAAAAVYVVVALAWLSATLLFPAHERPYAIGSTNGSAWNAAFVFNGTDRLGGKSPEPQTLYRRGYHYPTATQSERDHIPILPPSTTRLFALVGPLSGERLGLELLMALLLGAPALIDTLIRDRRTRTHGAQATDVLPGPVDASDARMHRAVAGGLGLWLLTGIVLFSHMTRLHPRYVEAFMPAVATLLGIGIAWACTGTGRARLITLAVALVACVYYVERLLYGHPPVWWVTLIAALAALTTAAVARRDRRARGRAAWLGGATIVLTLVAMLTLPVSVDVRAIHEHIGDAGNVGALPPAEQHHVSAYVLPRQGSAKYSSRRSQRRRSAR